MKVEVVIFRQQDSLRTKLTLLDSLDFVGLRIGNFNREFLSYDSLASFIRKCTGRQTSSTAITTSTASKLSNPKSPANEAVGESCCFPQYETYPSQGIVL